jgi:hypothetical protein
MNEILDGDWIHEIQPASLNGRLLGRGTLRRGATGPTAVRIPAWGFAFQPKTPGSRLERAYVDALSTLDEFEDLAATARKSGKFTDAGIVQEIGQHALAKSIPALHRGRETVRKARLEIAAARAKIALPAVDKTDAVSYLRRLEIRGHLAGMSEDKRRQFISKNREGLEPEWVQAIVEMSPMMSGVMESDHAWLLDRELRRLHGAAVDETRDAELALQTAENVVDLTRKEICKDLGVLPGSPPKTGAANMPKPRDINRPFDPTPGTALFQSQFDELAEIYEIPHDAPYLKRSNESMAEVVRVLKHAPGGSSWAAATEDDLERGIFYPTLEAYQDRRAA